MKKILLGAVAAIMLAAPLNAQNSMQTKNEFQLSTSYPIGQPNTANAQYFSGDSWLAPMDAEHGGPVNVTFAPGCRNHWHIHHHCVQVLICVAGRGWYQEWGKPAVEMTPGTVIVIPEGVKHWHGATADSWFQHLAYMTNVSPNRRNEWLEPVTNEQYSRCGISEQ